MEQAKEFILRFFDKEAECWTKLELDDLDDFNQSVRELYAMAIDELDESLGILQRTEVNNKETPKTCKPRYLYKLSSYSNKVYGDIWVAYASNNNPFGEGPQLHALSEGFILAEIDDEMKIIGMMYTKLNSLTLVTTGWTKSVYNPSDLDIKKLGKFIVTERYAEPANYDNWSLEEYLKER